MSQCDAAVLWIRADGAWPAGAAGFAGCIRSSGWPGAGVAPGAESAAAEAQRQAKRARAHYVTTALKRCTTTRTRRADLFCEGWVMTATELVENFAGSAAAQARVTAYLEHKHALTSFQGHNRNAGRNLSERDYGDMQAGHRAGRDAQLNRGVGGVGEQLSLEA